MRVVFISDTHNKHQQLVLPDGDLLIHAGDVSGRGTKQEIESFLNWFSSQPHKYKVFIAGNHDFFIEDHPREFEMLLPSNVIYLQDRMIDIEGKKIYGSPWTPRFMNWAFMKEKGDEIAEVWSNVPSNVDILITHGPVNGVLDKIYTGVSVGCDELARIVTLCKPKYFLCGHIHEAYGTFEQNGTVYMNGAVLNERYQLQNEPLIFEI